jgi:hypothetical protein
MATMDVFKQDAFSTQSLLAAIEKMDYKPQFLGSLNLFESKPQRTRAVMVESRDDALALIQTSPVGAPLEQRGADKRQLRTFNTYRIAKGSRIMADEIQGIRAFGSETELHQVQVEVARRMGQLQNDVDLTWEFHRLCAVQGILLDADGSTLLNMYTAFDVAQPAEVALDLANTAAGALRAKIEAITRAIIREAKGAFTTGSGIVALCGDNFWDDLVNHADVRTTYLNHEAAAALREPTAFSTFRYAGVTWVNYRGTDDGSTVAVGTDKAKFFPVGAPGVFQVAWAPAEFMDVVNQPGVPLRPLTIVDPSGRNAWVDVEVYSYPLYLCTRPLTLRSAKRGA